MQRSSGNRGNTLRTKLTFKLPRGKAEGRFKREGTYIYLWLIHVDGWQKPTLFCKAIILQLKIIFKKKKQIKNNKILQGEKKRLGEMRP